MNDQTRNLIQYRLARSRETLDDAQLLFSKGMSSSKHSGVLGLFNKEFVAKNIVDKESGRFFTEMFEFRQKADYKDFVEFKKEDVEIWLKNAGEFISKIGNLLSI